MVRDSNTGRGGRGKRFISALKLPDRLWGPPSLLFDGTWGSFLAVNRPGRGADHSPPCRAEVKNVWSYTSTPSICLHGVEKDKFTVYLSFIDRVIRPCFILSIVCVWCISCIVRQGLKSVRSTDKYSVPCASTNRSSKLRHVCNWRHRVR